jgi:hypothetical protein
MDGWQGRFSSWKLNRLFITHSLIFRQKHAQGSDAVGILKLPYTVRKDKEGADGGWRNINRKTTMHISVHKPGPVVPKKTLAMQWRISLLYAPNLWLENSCEYFNKGLRDFI